MTHPQQGGRPGPYGQPGDYPGADPGRYPQRGQRGPGPAPGPGPGPYWQADGIPPGGQPPFQQQPVGAPPPVQQPPGGHPPGGHPPFQHQPLGGQARGQQAQERQGEGVLGAAAWAGTDAVAHGAEGDPRYPSPRRLRRALAFAVDFLLHFGCGVGAFYGTQHIPALDNLIGLWALLGWIGGSLINRVLVQWAFATTVGKAIFGLRVVRKDGGRPRLGQLIIAWLVGLTYVVDALSIFGDGSGIGMDGKKYFLATVRMKDVRRLRSGAWPGLTGP
ncbi:MAG TPA: RDD family protein [Pseudonocardiaceae bacterium]|nr:RDD family protein [Pseudonocardiaceae bacterium]